MEIGKPTAFNVDTWLDYVEQLVSADEVELAFRALDACPQYYRDHVPERAREIRDQLNRALFTPVQYAGWEGTLPSEADAQAAWSHRFQALEREVLRMGRCHIMELAPGPHIARAGLRAKELDFTYESLSLGGAFREPVDDFTRPAIFVALELIEHLNDPWEIYRNYLKFGREAQTVMISTPLYTYNGGWPEKSAWRGQALGHLRTYSPASLHACVSQMFKGYEWSVETSDVIVLIGRR